MAEGSATIDLGGSAAVSVIELTNTLDPDLIGLGVSETSYQSHMHANNGYAEVTLSKEKNWLTITPSASAEAIERVYRVTCPDGTAEYRFVKDGESWELKDLPAGNYIIEAVKAPDGFSMELENPEIPVASGDSATVEINGESGSVVVTAGGTKGDGQIHHFTAAKKNDSSFKEEEFSLASGETYTRDHLTNGIYTLSAKTFEGTPAFSVNTSYGADEVDNGYFTCPNPKRGTLYLTTVPDADPEKGDFVRVKLSRITPTLATGYTARVYTYTGKDADGNPNPSLPALKRNTTTGKYEEVYNSQKMPVPYVTLAGIKTSANSSEWPSDTFRIPFSSNRQFGVGFPGVATNPNPLGITSFRVDWTVYRPDNLSYKSNYGDSKDVRVYKDAPDYTSKGNGWLEISKTPDTDEQILEHVAYKFTITNKSTGAQYTATLGGKDGPWSQRLGLPTGLYTVKQEIVQSKPPEAFTVSVKDKQYTTDKTKSITAAVAGNGSTIRLEKSSDPDDPGRQYRKYRFRITGPSFPDGVTVALSVDEPKKLRELLMEAGVENVPAEGQGYQAGDYTITPLDDNYVGFDLDYSDSCTVAIVGQPAVVTITNTYDKVDGSYRVVHEYYADERMTVRDGISEISQFTAPIHSEHTQADVTRVPTFTGSAGTCFYEYKEAVYGDYGSYETTALSVSGNSPEAILEEAPEKNPDVSENNPVADSLDEPIPDESIPGGPAPDGTNSDVSDPDMDNIDTDNADGTNSGIIVPEEENPDTQEPNGQDPDTENPDSSISDAENVDGQSLSTDDFDRQKSNTESPDEQTSDIVNTDDKTSGKTVSTAELSVTGGRSFGKYGTETAEFRTANVGRFRADAAKSRDSGSRYPDSQAYHNRIPKIKNTVSEAPDTGNQDNENPDEQNPAPESPDNPGTDEQNPNADGSGDAPADKLQKPDGELPDEEVSGNDMEAVQEPLVYALTAPDDGFKDDGSYKPNDSYESAQATRNGDKIIILRYVRRGIVSTGSYHVVHRYYLRDGSGDHLEGTVTDPEVTGLPLDYQIKYTKEKNAQEKPLFAPGKDGILRTYNYVEAVYGPVKGATTPEYQPATGKDCAYATPDGSEAIVLRYVRTVSYNVVHEYYLRTPSGKAAASPYSGAASLKTESGTNSDTEVDGSGDTDDTVEDSGGSDEGNPEISYQYSFEGRTRISTLTGNKDEPYTEARVDRILGFKPQSAPREYIYTPYSYAYGKLNTAGGPGYSEDAGMNNAVATEDGDQVIIIKYYREIGTETEPDPTPPPQPDPGPEPDDDHHRDPDPDPEPEPEIIPEPEPEPDLPTELPDPNDPDSPEKITIMEDGVPRTYVKVWDPRIDEWVYIPEEEVPLWGFPATGDNSDSILWIILSAASFAGILFLWADRDKEIFPKKRN